MRRISDYALRWARETPDAVAFTETGRDTTYGELGVELDAWAGFLLGLGVRRGDRVAMCARPSADALTVYLAAASIGAVFQGLNPAYTDSELEHVIGDAAPVVVVDAVDGRALGVAQTLAVPHVLHLDEAKAMAARAGASADAGTLEAARVTVGERDAALLVHTSGSTGRPKGALIPHGALVLAAQVHGRRWAGSRTTVLCPFPINHVASLSDIFGTALVAGGRTVLLGQFDPVEVLRLLESERVTFWGFVPAAAALVVAAPGWAAADLSGLEHVVWGGGAAPESLLAALRAKGLRPVGCYGSTETVGNVCFTGSGSPGEVAPQGSIGWVDEAYGARVDEATGELEVRSPEPFLGYLDQREATAAVFTHDGWLRTGDIAERCADGSFSLVGRVSEMYKSGGYNVYPREVELALERLPGVRLAAVLAAPDPVFGEVGHAFVVAPGLEAGDPAAASAALLADVRAWLAPYKVPKQLTVVAELPLLAVGKVDKVALRAGLESG